MIRKKYKTVSEYIASCPQNIQDILFKLRQVILKSAPGAEESISYAIPAYKLKSRNLVYFAAYEHHIGFYPTPSAIVVFKKDLSSFKQSKGAVQFPVTGKFPFDLVEKMVKFRVNEVKPQ